jgi:hypothetical protein
MTSVARAMTSGNRTLISMALGLLGAVGVLSAWSSLERRASTRHASTSNDRGERPRSAMLVGAPVAARVSAPRVSVPERTNGFELDAGAFSPEPQRAVEETAEELAFRLAQRFEADKPADATGRAFAKDVESAFVDQSKRGVRVKHAECRDRICKAQLRFDDAAQETSVLQDVLVHGPLRPYAVAVPERSEQQGGAELTLYLARTGELIDE